ncbi:MAG: GMC family oxidoreductase [Ignavibacteriae bacterium]|nr:GMC family oxidoreductase [Ignavibacteriota bacterium]
MDYTQHEKNFGHLLSGYAIVFLAGSAITAYCFLFHELATQRLLLYTPLILLLLCVFSKIAAGGIRRNQAFVDLLLLSLFLLSSYTSVRFVVLVVHSEVNTVYLSYALVSVTLYVVMLISWRKAVISRFALESLSPTQALAYRAMVEVVIGDYKAEGHSFDTTVSGFDRYLSSFQSDQKTQVKLVYLAVQFLPLLFLGLPLTWMGIEERRSFIKKKFYNSSGMLLTLIRSAKQLAYFIYYGSKPSFPSTGYLMFEERKRFKEMPKKPDPESLTVMYVDESRDIQTDICVIGSGAAGAVAAYELAKNTGKKVTILEQGKYFVPQKDFTNIEPEMIGSLYRDGALEMTQDFDMAILQGKCVGGSTTINNGICFRTPRPVLDEWEKLGASVDVDKLEKCFDRVEEIIQTKKLDVRKTNEGANRFFEGATKLRLNPEWFKTNFDECGGSGYCNIGCKYNRKLSMLLNYLPLALQHGAEIIADGCAVQIQTKGGKAEKIVCKTSRGTNFTVTAKHIVVAGGAVGSSALLLRSGIKRNVGTRLSFNVTTPVMAEFPYAVNSFDGVQMCCYVKGDGFLVETTFNPPGTSALIMQGWFETLNERMRRYTHYATAAPVVGSEPNGKVKLSLFGNTVVDYDMTAGDFKKLKEGMKMLSRIFLAAGAECVLPSSYDDLIIRSESDFSKIDTEIKKPGDISLSTAHPQGGNPLSDTKDIGAVDTNFRVHGFGNLYVCDGSVFPTCVKVNPQLSIMGLATYAAERISANV